MPYLGVPGRIPPNVAGSRGESTPSLRRTAIYNLHPVPLHSKSTEWAVSEKMRLKISERDAQAPRLDGGSLPHKTVKSAIAWECHFLLTPLTGPCRGMGSTEDCLFRYCEQVKGREEHLQAAFVQTMFGVLYFVEKQYVPFYFIPRTPRARAEPFLCNSRLQVYYLLMQGRPCLGQIISLI